ncbi:hypothetical protein GLOIN_2v1520974 [Rhizophagus irregularis DAOM 181602=DAOM 197198]|nr:hypothetical protein GLOIN_2v1520974 [Rhizophagus irregularis DAOM 181602=DAOM 197198]POG80041.1 hypothetical protein GLOIN_2v1520974 [Rhizophagus irregularis DAOM 181602=DAOM 197198]|eukprot:XP_025186907.1 hypothetical protein GLOIN_2v1520974 [Rhizophagus irregularis DAOM 181602=DAOM 197198]
MLQQELQNLTMNNEDLQEKLTELRNDYNSKKKELNDVISHRDELSSDKSFSTSKILQLQVDLDSSRQNFNSKCQELDNSRQELNIIQQELNSSKNEIISLKQDLESSKSELNSTQQQLNSTRQQSNSLQDDLNGLQNIQEKYNILKSQHNELLQRNNDLMVELEKSQIMSNNLSKSRDEYKHQTEQQIIKLKEEKEKIIRDKNVIEVENDLLKSQKVLLQESLNKLNNEEKVINHQELQKDRNIDIKESKDIVNREVIRSDPPPIQRRSSKRTSTIIKSYGSQDSLKNLGQESASIVQATLVKVEHRPQQVIINGTSQSHQISHNTSSSIRPVTSVSSINTIIQQQQQKRRTNYPDETTIPMSGNNVVPTSSTSRRRVISTSGSQSSVINKTSKRLSSIYSTNEEINDDSGVYLPKIVSPVPTRPTTYLITSNKGNDGGDQYTYDEPSHFVHNSRSSESIHNHNNNSTTSLSKRTSLYNPPSPSQIPKLVDVNKRSSGNYNSAKPLPSIPKNKSDELDSSASSIKSRRSIVSLKGKRLSILSSNKKEEEVPLCDYCVRNPCKKKAVLKGYSKYCSNECKKMAQIAIDSTSDVSQFNEPKTRSSYSSSIRNSTDSLSK